MTSAPCIKTFVSLHSDQIRLVAFATLERAKSNNGEPDCAASVVSFGRGTRSGPGLPCLPSFGLPCYELLMTRE
jgi:hypothetical protein